MSNNYSSLIKKYNLGPKLFLILSLTLCSTKTSGETNLDFSCLNRNSKESIVNCFDEKFVCESTLKDLSKSTAPGGKIYNEIMFAVLAGFAVGFIVDRQIHF